MLRPTEKRELDDLTDAAILRTAFGAGLLFAVILAAWVCL